MNFTYVTREKLSYVYQPSNFIGLKVLLEQFDTLSDEMKRLLINTCKQCNGCLFCTKGKNNKIHAQTVTFDDQERKLCPNYPNMYWHNANITDGVVAAVWTFNDLQEINGKDWRK